MKFIAIILALLAGLVVGHSIGRLEPAVQAVDTLPSMYDNYLTITMYEDGSYEAVTRAGERVTGCIKNALCEKE